MEENIKFCPECKSTVIQPLVGGIMGMWRCSACGYLGSLFPEKIIEKKLKKKLKGEKYGRRRKS